MSEQGSLKAGRRAGRAAPLTMRVTSPGRPTLGDGTASGPLRFALALGLQHRLSDFFHKQRHAVGALRLGRVLRPWAGGCSSEAGSAAGRSIREEVEGRRITGSFIYKALTKFRFLLGVGANRPVPSLEPAFGVAGF